MRSSKDSKQELVLPLTEPVGKSSKNPRLALIGALFAGLLVLYPISCSLSSHGPHHTKNVVTVGDVCPQVDPLLPASDANRKLAEELGAVFGNSSFEAIAAAYLGGAVRIPTESYDKMDPVGTDPRWDVFYKFSEHLQKTFPKVHTTLSQTRINTHALLYHWPGTDSSLKPILLTAHQDVVPVEPNTVSSWLHPPYSGHYDGTWIWGRGATDDKSGLIGIMIALERLIEGGFKPKRGILVGFGMDEEASGLHGAQHIAKYIEEHYGKDSVSVLVDEGGGIQTIDGMSVAQPAVAEKGYLDVRVEVATPGGHSSVPPEHTSIGILASLLVEIESTPYTPGLPRSSPIYNLLQCFAAHVPSVPSSFRSAVLDSICSSDASARQRRRCDQALQDVEKALFDASSEWNHGNEFAARSYRSLLRTTQAIDMINGGVKANALPELTSAVVNHRIRTDSSVSELIESITSKLIPLAEKFNLTLTSFSRTNVTTGKVGTLTLSDAWGTALDPAPITPTIGTEAAAYKLLSGVIRHTRGDKKTVVSPAIMSGNTDTRYYWKVTPNIFRYSHMSDKDVYNGAHTINEATRASGFVELIQFFKNFILTADDSTDL
ncbi:gly-Xaa carboxypeptidase [Rhizoctonia solani 123E]|uniref:Gly-Xaa carboxypeptidase n=1 Tax=Rhizoctonia solani 123E TaxID=1423351 RepID=A0A074S444_9AGAM|nr:gly-Xaa carboxypeptidase [Rhizoctonia solani 123E]